MILLRAYRAVDDEESCLNYADGHRKVLEGFNLGNISTNNNNWAYNPHVYVVEAKDIETGELLGGIRVQIADGRINLPVQDAVSHFDPKVNDMVRHYALNGGTSELCGLWNSRSLAPNIGVTVNLVIAGMAICSQIPVTSLFTIVAQYTLKIARRMGFQIETSLGIDGEFVYPNSNFVARVLSMNPQLLKSTHPIFRSRITKLRENPKLESLEKVGKEQTILYTHDLKIESIGELEWVEL
ncbi:MAG: hypothetical protein MK086_05330 [Flavobacteriales bacterium]|nr:hypothetical protein [Flavobacteriales bacterium]